jgi:hypothetical protein
MTFQTKKISTVIYNLRSGYAKLNDYRHKLNITESANCQCGERETVEHYILHCDQYEEAREKLIHDIFLLSGSSQCTSDWRCSLQYTIYTNLLYNK